jgi:hypothetical protein
MMHHIRVGLMALLIAIALVLIITYYYISQEEQTKSYALEPVYQFVKECEAEYVATTGTHLDDSKKTQLLSLSYKTFYRGSKKPVLTTPNNPYKKFGSQLHQESVDAMRKTSLLLSRTQLQNFCTAICPKAVAKKINTVPIPIH